MALHENSQLQIGFADSAKDAFWLPAFLPLIEILGDPRFLPCFDQLTDHGTRAHHDLSEMGTTPAILDSAK